MRRRETAAMETSEIISHSTGVEVTSQNNEDTWSGGSQETGRFITCNYLQLVFIEVYSSLVFQQNFILLRKVKIATTFPTFSSPTNIDCNGFNLRISEKEHTNCE